jgi:flagellar biosynthesis GTPase FlhF
VADKKEKTVKKVTEIDNAKVTIEVEETVDPKEAEKEEPQAAEENKEEAEASESTQEQNQASTIAEEPENAQEEAKNTEAEESEEPKSETEVVQTFDDSDGFSFKKMLLIILVVVPIGFLIFGGVLFFTKNFNMDKLKEAETEKKLVLPTTAPSPTEEPLDKEAFTIEIQNGSGIAGEGARVSEILEEEGFKVGDVGNASSSDYEETEITVNDDVPDSYIEALTKVLEDRGEVAKVKKFASGEDGEVLVILGSDVKDAP